MKEIIVKQKNRYTWLIIVLSIIALALIAFIVWDKWLKKSSDSTATETPQTVTTESQDNQDGTASVTPTPSTPTTTPATPVTSEADNITAVNKVATSFLTAWSQRDLESAKPFMTTTYFNSTDQGSFAGVSSPGRGRFTLDSTTAVTASQKYTVKVTAYQTLGGTEIGSAVVTLDIIKSGSSFLVNSLTEGALVQK